MAPRQTTLSVVVAGLTVWVILLASVGLGMRVPARHVLGSPGGGGSLDYSAFGASLSPLSPEYLSRVLGVPLAGHAPESGTPRASVAAPGSTAPADALSRGDTPRSEVTHPLTNDGFSSAYAVSSIPFTAHTNTSEATRESGEPIGCGPAGSTVWYQYRPDSAIGLVANTVGTAYPVALGIYTGSSVSDLEQRACDADAQGNAHVVLPADAGTTYYFQVTAPTGGGPLVFNLDPVGTTTRASVSSGGELNDGTAQFADVSADGRYVAFHTWVDNLSPHDNNLAIDVFVHDRLTGGTEPVSVTPSGETGNDHSAFPAISADGRYVSFVSDASDLVRGDTNGLEDIFVRDRVTSTTSRVSISSSGHEGNVVGPSPYTRVSDYYLLQMLESDISSDGRYVAFEHYFDNLVPGRDTNNDFDVFVHDRRTGTTDVVSVGAPRDQAIGGVEPAISADGRHVAFHSDTALLSSREPTELFDVFVHDRRTGVTSLVSASTSGGSGNGDSRFGSISADGRFVAFHSEASNLVAGDTNGFADYFVHDRATGSTSRVSVSSAGAQQVPPPSASGTPQTRHGGLCTACARERPSISGDGRLVAFSSTGANLVAGDDNGTADVFVHDRAAGTTIRVSVTSAGREGTGYSFNPAISADGHHIAFDSNSYLQRADPEDYPEPADHAQSYPLGQAHPATRECRESPDTSQCAPEIFVHTFPRLF